MIDKKRDLMFISILLLVLLIGGVYAVDTTSSNYQQNVVVTDGGETEVSSDNYKQGVSIFSIIGETISAVYKTFLGFWYGVTGGIEPGIELFKPVNDSYHKVSYALLNGTVKSSENNEIDIYVWGANSTESLSSGNHSLLYIMENVADTDAGINVTYNWTAPVVQPDYSTVLLMHFDNLSRYGETTEGLNNKTFDYSGNGNDGVIYGANFNQSEGKSGGSFEFDSNTSFITLGDGILNLGFNNTNFSIAAWIKIKDISTGKRIFSNEKWDLWPGWYLSISDNKISGRIKSHPDGSTIVDVQSSNTLLTNVWYHVAMTVDRSSSTGMKLFLNGDETSYDTQEDPTAITTGIDNGMMKATIGKYDYGSFDRMLFNGSIDEIAIWNRSLSADEIKDLYRLKSGRYYWKINSTDSSGVSNESETWQFTIDQIKPEIEFVYPTPYSKAAINESHVYVNVSVSDNNQNYSAFIDWNRSLVGWWTFDYLNSTNLLDNSSYSNDGTLESGLSQNDMVNAIRGKGLAFDGINDRISLLNSTSLNITGEVSITAWFKNGPRTGGDTSQDLLFKFRSYALSLYSDDGINFNPYGLIGDGNGWTVTRACSDTVTADEWHFMAMTFNRTNLSIYYDGSFCHSNTGDEDSFNTSAYPVSIGSFDLIGSYGEWFNGTIDELMLFRRGLTEDEVMAIYDAGTNRLYKNFTDLSEAEYNYTAYVIDRAGNINQTEERTLTVDFTKPEIEFVYPTPFDKAAINESTVYTNVSVSDDNDNYSAFIDWNRSLVAWLRMEEGNGTFFVDSGSYGNNGTCVKESLECPQLETGIRGDAYVFNGNLQEIKIVENENFDRNSSFTIESWIKIKNANGMDILGKWGNTNNNRSYVVIINTNNKLRFVVNQNGTEEGNVGIVSDNSISINQWHHFTALYNTSHISIYIDGNPAATPVEYNRGIYDSVENISIGFNNYNAQQFNGTIDEFKFWKRALSPREINASYQAGTNSLERRFTNLTEGTYTYKAYSLDKAGNVNETEERTLTVDNTLPEIVFIDPTPIDKAIINSSYVNINVSVSDNNDNYSAFIDWNRSLVGWWRMEEGNGSYFVDSSSYQNNGTQDDSERQPRLATGIRGKAYEFDGVDDYLNLTNSSLYQFVPTDKFSVGVWVRFNSFAGSKRHEIVRSYDGLNFEGISLLTAAPISESAAFYFALSSAGHLKYYVGTTNSVFYANQWYHILVNYDGSEDASGITIFINGVNQSLSTMDNDCESTIDYSDNYLVIGKSYNTDSERFLNGSVDELMIWNRVLSPEEINASYQAGLNKLDIRYSDLSSGNYTYKAYAVDKAGNVNSTEERALTVDNIKPDIEFVYPTPFDKAAINDSTVYINVSVSDDNDNYSAFIDWNRSLVGWWRLEEGNGSFFADSSSYMGNGTQDESSRKPKLVNGIRGKAYEFDGVDDRILISEKYFNYSGITDLGGENGSITLSIWFKRKDSVSVNRFNVMTHQVGGFDYFSAGGNADNRLRCMVYDGINDVNYWPQSISEIVPDVWTHAVFTFVGGSGYKFYINGNLDRNFTNTDLRLNDYGPPYIGLGFDDDSYFNGSIDEVMLWKRELSAAEINASYQAGIYRLERNFTNLTEGNYTYKAYVVDKAGNVNSTEERKLTVDTTLPDISFVYPTPANNTINSSAYNYAYINVSLSDNHGNYSAFIDWNRSLVGWWRFEKGNGSHFVGSSSYRENLTQDNQANAPKLIEGIRGKAYLFDGVNDNVITSSAPQPQTSGTIQAWIKINGWGNSYDSIVFKGPGIPWADIDYGLFRSSTSSQFIGTLNDGSNNLASNGPKSSNLELNRWYHLTFSWNESKALFYTDGNLTGSYDWTYGAGARSANMRVGSDVAGSGYFFNGTIDEIMIWKRDLSADEINASYQAGLNRLENNFTGLTPGTYNYKAYVVDKAGNLNSTEERTFTIQSNYPMLNTSINNSAPKINEVINLTANFSDSFKVTKCQFIHNQSGNVYENKTISASSGQCSENFTIELPRDSVINFTIKIFNEAGNTNQSEHIITVANTPPPQVTLVGPPNMNETINRTPTFVWNNITDADGDKILFNILIECVECSIDNRDINTTNVNYTPPNYLEYLYDEDYYYNWSVRAIDNSSSGVASYGSWSSEWNISISSYININFTTATINFGTMNVRESKNTTDASIDPFVLENFGNVYVNVSLYAADQMWDNDNIPTDRFRFKIDNTTELYSFNWTLSKTNFTHINLTANLSIVDLSYKDSNDTCEIDILVEVPPDEGPGVKDSKLVFEATRSK